MDYEAHMLTILERMLLDESAEPTDLPYSLLERITNYFSNDLQIGSGGFAVVYKGCLGNGGTVAVKKLSNRIDMDETKYNQEVACLMRVKHKNIVRFLGYCADTRGKMSDYEGNFVMADVRHRLLCFEYLRQGSLDEYIKDASCGLNWRERYQIIKGICEGLRYLHEKRIVHLDLKPANILLDDNMVPKISDFGLSRCFGEQQNQTITAKPVGSMGYMAPEFFGGVITLKSDIYSLGVIITEMLTGQRGYSLDDNVIESWRNRMDISVAETLLEQVRICAEISIDCVDFDPTRRPDIQSIIQKLAKTETDNGIESGSTASLVEQDGLRTSTWKVTTKSSAERFSMRTGRAKAPYTPAVSVALMKIDAVLADESAKSMVAKFCADSTNLEVMIQHIRIQLEHMIKISMVYMTNDSLIWFANVRKLAYRVEDVMDKYLYYSLQMKHESFLMLNFIKGSHYRNVFNEITDELVKIEDEIWQVKGLQPSNMIFPLQLTKMERQQAKLNFPDHVKHEDLLGMEDNRRMLTEWLYSDGPGSTVIAVSGMGGSGKTVLASLVYEREMPNFPVHAWIDVSQIYNVEALYRRLFMEVSYVEQYQSVEIEKMHVDDLRSGIRRRLKDRKYLIVLDDVWNQDVYFQICKEFENTQASRIVITTRKNQVAALAPPTRRLDLKPLSSTNAFTLFCRTAFQDNMCPMELQKYATSIVARCQGLPLAIVTIGRLLSARGHTDNIWGQMFYQVRNELSKNDGIREILNPVYNDLSGDLKNCFLYCCLFPEDYLISCEGLMKLWVAEGFVRSSENNTAEEVAERNLMELIDSNLLVVGQSDEQGRAVTCGMHRIIRDLACAVAKKENFESANNYSSMMTVNRNVRRLSWCQWNDNRTTKIEFPYLRTLVSLGTISSSLSMLSSILSGSIYLAVLELRDSDVTEVPECLGALFNLRYIGLRRTKVKSLPDSVCKLYNLQTLDIKQTRIQNLPRGISNVKKLQHLFVDRCTDENQEGFPCTFEVQEPKDISNLSEFQYSFGVQPPKDLSNLEYLETLETVQSTMDLPDQLKNLRWLRNVWIDNISSTDSAKLFATLSNMRLLSSLSLFAKDKTEELSLDALEPRSTELHKLIIRGRFLGFGSCPIFGPRGKQLKYLALSWCELWQIRLEILAEHLTNLTYLRLDNMQGDSNLFLSAGSFPNLKTLVLKNVHRVNQLVIKPGALPCTDALYIVSLPDMDRVPRGLESLRSLKKLWLLNLHNDFRTQWEENRMEQQMQFVLELRV